MTKRRGGKRVKTLAQEPIVNGFAAQHGDYREATVVDLGNELGGGRQKTYRVLRVTYPNTVDKWLAEGGPGFGEPQARAIDHCRNLWAALGSTGRLVASYGESTHTNGGRERGTDQHDAFAAISQYEQRIPKIYWSTFEMLCRDDYGAGAAGAVFADNSAQRQAHSKNVVGFVASLIAMWNGY